MKARATKKNGLPIRGERCFGARVEIVDTLAFGEEFEVVEEYDGWLYIEGKGWCDASYTEPVTFDAGSGGSGGVTSWNDLEDKPFGEEVMLTEIYSGQHDFSSDEMAVLPDFIGLVEGESYLVEWDGTKYESVCKKIVDGAFYLGNLSVAGEAEDTGEPFIFMDSYANGTGVIMSRDRKMLHTAVYKKSSTIIRKLDPKFLPEPMFLYVV